MENIQSLKEKIYIQEMQFFSPYAALSENSKGRTIVEEACPMRTDYQRDRDRIIYCNSFKRLKNKTQVFFSPEGDHCVTRLTHTLDVAQIARSMARTLSLNQDLAEAIALGHDLGHTPFGHSGERVLDSLAPCGFKHNEQSLRVVDLLEKHGRGLNLTFEVRDGILNHNKYGKEQAPKTLEGNCVCLADRIAYINHDLDDAIRAGIINACDVPKSVTEVLGNSSRERINTALCSIYERSNGKNHVAMQPEVERASEELRRFMFENVYKSPSALFEEQKAEDMLSRMYKYYMADLKRLPQDYKNLLKNSSEDRVVCDYISSMTDRFALTAYKGIFLPKE